MTLGWRSKGQISLNFFKSMGIGNGVPSTAQSCLTCHNLGQGQPRKDDHPGPNYLQRLSVHALKGKALIDE